MLPRGKYLYDYQRACDVSTTRRMGRQQCSPLFQYKRNQQLISTTYDTRQTILYGILYIYYRVIIYIYIDIITLYYILYYDLGVWCQGGSVDSTPTPKFSDPLIHG